MDTVYNGIGLLGAGAMIWAFFLLQHERLSRADAQYHWLNLAGAAAVMVSLMRFWNLPAFVMEICWILISAYGLLRSARMAR